jgi:hypothetical protein
MYHITMSRHLAFVCVKAKIFPSFILIPDLHLAVLKNATSAAQRPQVSGPELGKPAEHR